MGLSDVAEKIGFKSLGVQIDFKTLVEAAPKPCIIHWNKLHFVVVYKIDKTETVYISYPSYGLITYSKEDFIKHWIGINADETTEEGIALLLETTSAFFKNEFDVEEKLNWIKNFDNTFKLEFNSNKNLNNYLKKSIMNFIQNIFEFITSKEYEQIRNLINNNISEIKNSTEKIIKNEKQ